MIKIILLILFLPSIALCAPADIVVGSTAVHGSSLSISGSGFGTKNPAAPLWWDNGEGAIDQDRPPVTGDISWITTSLSTGNKHYSEAIPIEQTYQYDAALMRYRAAPYRSVTAPHSRSTRFMAGAHYQYCLSADDQPDCDGENNPAYINGGSTAYQNVMLTVDSGVADKDIWYVSFYHRLDPLWPTDSLDLLNHKFSVFQTEDGAYEGGSGNNIYQSWDTEPESVSGNTVTISQGNNSACGNNGAGVSVHNPRLAWIKMETLTDVGSSPLRRVLVDNVIGYDGATISSCVEDWAPATRSFTIGGYYRRGTGDNINANYRGGRDAFRYFDDLYVDNTFSRVMICNNATYASATICEPQIPSAWSASAITVTVNQGALSIGTNYLFVFDSDNAANATGVEVTFSDGLAGGRGVTFSGASFY